MSSFLLILATLPSLVLAEPATPGISERAMAPEKCDWCVVNEPAALKEIAWLGALSPKQQLKKVRAKGVCVKVMDSQRPIARGRFGWSQVEKPSEKMSSLPQISAVMAKTLCKGEVPLSNACPTILLASDAPAIALMHEYIHHLQNGRDASWCETAKQLWTRSTTSEIWRLIRNREWDDYRLLWRLHDRIKLRTEDGISMASALISEAEQRRVFDKESENFITSNRVNGYLAEQLKKWKKP